MLNKARIAVLVSGGGTNLEALFNAQAAGSLPHGEIVLVLSSNPDALPWSGPGAGASPPLPCPGRSWAPPGSEAALTRKLTEYQVDLIVLAGFLSILSSDFVRRWPDRIVNVHPLPDPRLLREGVLRAEGPPGGAGAGREGHRRHRPPGE